MMEAIRFATEKNERTPGRQPWMTDKIWEQHQNLIKKIATPEVQAIIADVKKHSSTIITFEFCPHVGTMYSRHYHKRVALGMVAAIFGVSVTIGKDSPLLGV